MEKNDFIHHSYDEKIQELNEKLRLSESFDLVSRQIKICEKRAMLYFIDGFIKDDLMERIMQSLMNLKKERIKEIKSSRDFADSFVPYIETEIVDRVEDIKKYIFSGALAMIIEDYAECIIIDVRTYPARTVGEPENDKVLRGSHDGFVETLIFNTALIRRRIRDEKLTMHALSIGEKSKTDVVLCYMDGLADKKDVENVKKKLHSIKVNSLTMGHATLAECLQTKQKFNPFPKIRYTERPDSAAACLYEGSMLIITDNSPSVMVIPTGIFEFLQDTNDYYFPPLIGSYMRIVRLISFGLTLTMTPVWFLLIQNPDIIPPALSFIKIDDPTKVPVIFQLLIIELIVDALKIASLNTPSAFSNSFSMLGTLLLGEFAIKSNLFVPQVVLYMAFVAITNFAQPSYELGYAFKLCRIMVLILTRLFNFWGFGAGFLIIILLISFNKTVTDRCYLYPLIPFNFKVLTALLFRKPLSKSRN